jgi:uncharacterized protein (TIGR02466 family)
MAETFNFTINVPVSAGAATNAPILEPYDLFPTRIWQSRLSAMLPHLAHWTEAVLAMRAANPRPAGRTNRRGWNSEDMTVLEQPLFAPLQQAVRAACMRALGEMGVQDIPFGLQSWINLHDRSLLSGSFYIKVPPGSGRFVFRDPRPGVIHGYVKGAVPNGYRDIQLTPEPALLVLFPSWMEHFVEPHDSDEPRITIAFNANESKA